MCDSPFAVYAIANFQDTDWFAARSSEDTPCRDRPATCASSRSSFAHGSRGKLTRLEPAVALDVGDRSASDPGSGRDRIFLRQGSLGTGWLVSSESRSTGVPGLMKDTPPSTVCPLGDGCPVAVSPPGALPPRPCPLPRPARGAVRSQAWTTR